MPNNKMALVLAFICASIASFFIYKVMKESSKPKVVNIPKTNIVVAKTVIPARSVVQAEQVELKAVPTEGVTRDTAQKIEEVVGSIAKSEILDGESINLNRLVRKGESVGLSFVIPPGMRAITIAMTEVIGVAGFIKTGEKVDIIGIVQSKNDNISTAWTVLQDIEVLAVSQDMGNPVKDEKNGNTNSPSRVNEAKVGTSVTLAVTPLQAERVALAEQKGQLRLTLRPVLKENQLLLPSINENNLITGDSPIRITPSRPSTNSEPNHRKIEIISGGNTQILTVY
jgi:pilus assembly protein CpaB